MSFLCNEGTFGTTLTASFCGNVDWGTNDSIEHLLDYNVGGNADCITKLVGGDDVDAGPVRGLSTHGAAGGCTAQTGIYERYTVSITASYLFLSNGIPINTNGSIWTTFVLDADVDGVPDGTDNCTLVTNANQLDADGDGYGNICDADLNNSGLVTAADFNLLRSCINQLPPLSPLCAAADMNSTGLVTAADFNLLRARINTAPGPSGLHP